MVVHPSPAHPEFPQFPGVSVIIPAYNYARYLATSINSVLKQDYADFEVLVVDDGSTDNTREVVLAFSDSRIRYIHQANAGLSAARNTGIASSRFPYVAFLDADDEWLPAMLSTVVSRFAAIPEDFGMVASMGLRVDASGDLLQTKTFDSVKDRILTARDIILKTRFLPSSVVAKRCVFDKCGLFDTTMRSSEDRDMWIRIGQHYRIYFIATPLVHIRKHASNMSRQAARMKESMGIVIARAFHKGIVPKWNLPFWLRTLSIYCIQTSWTHYDEGHRSAALRYVLCSILAWPLFLNPHSLNEPVLFRIRALVRFLFANGPANSQQLAVG